MEKIFFLLVGISLFYPAYADTGGTSTDSGTYSGINPNPSINPNPGVNTVPDTSAHPSTDTNPNDHGLGNGGNTTGVGTDHGGGNGPAN